MKNKFTVERVQHDWKKSAYRHCSYCDQYRATVLADGEYICGPCDDDGYHFVVLTALAAAQTYIDQQHMDQPPHHNGMMQLSHELEETKQLLRSTQEKLTKALLEKLEQRRRIKSLGNVALALCDWIDAVPKAVVATLPAMPGTDRDWVDRVIAGGDQ